MKRINVVVYIICACLWVVVGLGAVPLLGYAIQDINKIEGDQEMSPEKSWVKQFTKDLEKTGLISEFTIQRKWTTSWSNITFTITPADAAEQILELVTSVNRLILKGIIDRAQGHEIILGLLATLFNFQFDIFFILI